MAPSRDPLGFLALQPGRSAHAFSPALGFEVLEAGFNSPCRIYFEKPATVELQTPFHRSYGGSTILVRKVRDFSPDDFRWNTSMEEVLPEGSAYPKPVNP